MYNMHIKKLTEKSKINYEKKLYTNMEEKDELCIVRYINPLGEDVECYYYLAVDDGESKKEIPEELKEKLIWINPKDVKEKLSYDNLKEIWEKVETEVNDILSNITPAKLTDIGVCPTCFDKENNNCLYGEK